MNEGTLLLDKIAASTGTTNANAIAVDGNLQIGDGLGGNNADVVRLLQSNQIATTATVTVNPANANASSGLLDLDGNDQIISGLTMNGGNVTLNGGTLTFTTVNQLQAGPYPTSATIGNGAVSGGVINASSSTGQVQTLTFPVAIYTLASAPVATRRGRPGIARRTRTIGGYFYLIVNGQQVGPIQVANTANQLVTNIQTALNSMPGLAGNTIVAAPTGSVGTTVTITFINQLAGVSVPVITVVPYLDPGADDHVQQPNHELHGRLTLLHRL